MVTDQLGVLEQNLAEGDVEETQEKAALTEEQTSQEEPDYKALYEQAEGARKKAEDNARAQRIQLLTARQRDERLERIEQLMLDIADKFRMGDLNETEAKAAIRKGVTTIEDETGETTGAGTLEDEFMSLFAEVTREGLKGEDLQGVSRHYEKGKSAFEANKPELARAYLTSAQTAFDLIKARQGRPLSAAALALNKKGRQRTAVVSDQQWLNRYADEVNGGIPGTPANAEKARALRDKGLVPQRQ